MQHQRTQIYLDPGQHAALLNEARRRSISLAGLIRELVDEHFARRRAGALGLESRKAAALSLMGLGKSGFQDVSEKTDRYLAEALGPELVKEKGRDYGRPSRRRKR